MQNVPSEHIFKFIHFETSQSLGTPWGIGSFTFAVCCRSFSPIVIIHMNYFKIRVVLNAFFTGCPPQWEIDLASSHIIVISSRLNNFSLAARVTTVIRIAMNSSVHPVPMLLMSLIHFPPRRTVVVVVMVKLWDLPGKRIVSSLYQVGVLIAREKLLIDNGMDCVVI